MRTLKQIYIHGWLRWRVGTVFMHVTNDANDGQQPEIAIHISKFNGVADGVLAGPARASERRTDQGHVCRVRAVAVIEHSPANDGNSKCLKISSSRDAKIR